MIEMVVSATLLIAVIVTATVLSTFKKETERDFRTKIDFRRKVLRDFR
jgi:hypothetical protein